jgi:hypothetical protein
MDDVVYSFGESPAVPHGMMAALAKASLRGAIAGFAGMEYRNEVPYEIETVSQLSDEEVAGLMEALDIIRSLPSDQQAEVGSYVTQIQISLRDGKHTGSINAEWIKAFIEQVKTHGEAKIAAMHADDLADPRKKKLHEFLEEFDKRIEENKKLIDQIYANDPKNPLYKEYGSAYADYHEVRNNPDATPEDIMAASQRLIEAEKKAAEEAKKQAQARGDTEQVKKADEAVRQAEQNEKAAKEFAELYASLAPDAAYKQLGSNGTNLAVVHADGAPSGPGQSPRNTAQNTVSVT